MTWFSNAWFSRAAFCLMKNWHKAYVKNPVEVMTAGEVGEAAQLLCRREKNDGRMKQVGRNYFFPSMCFFLSAALWVKSRTVSGANISLSKTCVQTL